MVQVVEEHRQCQARRGFSVAAPPTLGRVLAGAGESNDNDDDDDGGGDDDARGRYDIRRERVHSIKGKSEFG